MEKKAKRNRFILRILSVFTILMLVLTIVGLIIFNLQINAYEASGINDFTTYSRLYAYIANNSESTVSENLYQNLREYGLMNDCYVERVGDDLVASYSKEELLSIAIKSKVSGIILEGDDSDETAYLIEQANQAGIPVVTVMTDAPGTSRCSFIGLNNYSAGVKYGNLVLDMAASQVDESLNALVIMSSGDSNESVLYAAIQERISGSGINLSSTVIETDSVFNTEEKVIDLLEEYSQLPDIIICLSDINTRCVYQYAVDKNVVGVTTIIGYYDSSSVLEGIERGAIDATLSVDTNQLARYCVDALNEYIELGNVSEYYSTDYVLISRENVNEYLVEDAYQEATNEGD